MDILVAEYAVGAGEDGTILLEGRAMLEVLTRSFLAAGNRVIYPTSGPLVSAGTPVPARDFAATLESLSRQCDAALVVAPDELLEEFTRLIEAHTVNLGCPAESVRLCADKLECARILNSAGIRAPRTLTGTADFDIGQQVVIKPRWGCASEDTTIVEYNEAIRISQGFVATEYIRGEHLSVSLVAGDTVLPISVNRQNVHLGTRITYDGGTVGIDTGRNHEIFQVAKNCARLLGCRGYVGMDMVMADELWVIDVNPRPTTSIIGLDRIMDPLLGELILAARFHGLPDTVYISGEFTFTKADLDNKID